VTHSSGNHGQAVAFAATLFNKKSHIIMPYNSVKSKILAVCRYQLNPDYKIKE
jgi:threonine dehydratase